MISLISIYCGGILSLLMALFHTRFYVMFKWKKEFEKMGTVNQKIFYTIHFALLLLFFMMGFLSLIHARELSICIGLSYNFCLMYALFWLWRMIWQISFFKGKLLHIIMIVFFFFLFIAYIIPVIVKLIKV